MSYPLLITDLNKLYKNCRNIIELAAERGISVTGITKSVFNDFPIAETMLSAGCNSIGESRIANLKKIKYLSCQKVLTRIPMLSEIDDVIEYADISLNSELEAIKKINERAKSLGVIHKIFLVVETGDLREGETLDNIESTVSEILKLGNIELLGLASNMACLSDNIPNLELFNFLLNLRKKIEEMFNISLILSAGNSSFLHLLPEIGKQERINIRIGEGFLLGRDTAQKKTLPGSFDDVFILETELIELKRKEGHLRGILAMGKVETDPEGITPLDPDIEVIGATSDHTIIRFRGDTTRYKLGDKMLFKVDYWTLLKLFSLPDIEKKYI